MLTHKLTVVLFLAALTGCDLTSKAIVVVNTPGAVSSGISAGNQQQNQTSTSPTSTTVVNVPSSTQGASDLSIFKSSIPRPQETEKYGKADISKASEFFASRYQASKENAFEVLKMWLDAELIGTVNGELGKALLENIIAKNGDDAKSGLAMFNVAYSSSRPILSEYVVGTIYQNVSYSSSLKKLSYEDFNNRVLSAVKEVVSPDGIQSQPIQNPSEYYSQIKPKDGEKLTIKISGGPSYIPTKAVNIPLMFNFIYDDGWKPIFSMLANF